MAFFREFCLNIIKSLLFCLILIPPTVFLVMMEDTNILIAGSVIAIILGLIVFFKRHTEPSRYWSSRLYKELPGVNYHILQIAALPNLIIAIICGIVTWFFYTNISIAEELYNKLLEIITEIIKKIILVESNDITIPESEIYLIFASRFIISLQAEIAIFQLIFFFSSLRRYKKSACPDCKNAFCFQSRFLSSDESTRPGGKRAVQETHYGYDDYGRAITYRADTWKDVTVTTTTSQYLYTCYYCGYNYETTETYTDESTD